MPKQEDQHKGKFVGAYLSEDQFDKLTRIEEQMAGIFGKDDVTRSKVLRYIIEYFDEKMLPKVPKDAAPTLEMAPFAS